MELKHLLLVVLVCFAMTSVVAIAEKIDDADYYGYYDDAEYYGEYSDQAVLTEETNVLAELVSAPFAIAEEAGKVLLGTADGVRSFFERDILSGPDRFLRRSFLDPSGLTMGISAKTVYTQNTKGGYSTHNKAGRFKGDYSVELAGDMEKFFGLKGGLYMNAEGSWSKTAGRRSLDIIELWYEQAMFDESLRVRVGKLDLGGGFECRGCPVSFDGNSYANSGTSQFFNGNLGNNPQIPFPEQGLGIMAYYNPVEYWYAGFGFSDAQADARETGFNTAMRGEDYFVYMAETGVTPQIDSANGVMQGAYRVGIWVDGQDKERFSNGNNYRDDLGVYSSCDQMVYKENSDDEDQQGIGVFGRWGWAQSDLNEVNQFLSCGVQYQGIIDGRDDDVLAFGMAHGILTNQDNAGFTEDNETAYEVYYSAVVSDNLTLSPSLQYIKNTDAASIGDTMIVGLRAHVAF
jgi:porin